MGWQNLLKQTARYAINQEVLKWLTKNWQKDCKTEGASVF
jgi:hypothetical protein